MCHMRFRLVLLSFLTLSLFFTGVDASIADYHPSIVPSLEGNTQISWTVVDAPDLAVEWLFFQGSWLANDGSTMNFTILEIDSYLTGELKIGNASLIANNTDLALELLLGVWGIIEFFPGLIIKIGQDNFNTLNETAYASAARVRWNYLNGTMTSSYEEVIVGGVVYDCLVFEYQQDPTGWGEPQESYLAYDTETGVLIKADTSVFIFNEYRLVLEFNSISQPLPILLLSTVSGGSILVLIVVVILWKKSE